MCHQGHSQMGGHRGGYCHPHQHSYEDRQCCCSGGRGWRRFISKAEKKEHLMRYREELEAELTAVNELLSEFGGE